MTSVTLDEVVFDESIYPRAKWSQETVDRYADALEASDHFPAIILEAGTKRLLDGKHRFEAHAQLGRKFIAAELVEIPEGVPAKLFAASLSSRHGDPLSVADKRHVAREVTEANPDFSMVEVAAQLGISRNTVSRYVADIVERRREVRRIQATLLGRAGWSHRQIGEHLGVAHTTVVRDAQASILHQHSEELIRDAAKDLPVDVTAIVEEILRERAVPEPSETAEPAGVEEVTSPAPGLDELVGSEYKPDPAERIAAVAAVAPEFVRPAGSKEDSAEVPATTVTQTPSGADPFVTDVAQRLKDDLARDSARRAAATGLRSVMTYTTSRVLTPQAMAQEYADVLDQFSAAELRFAAETLAAIVALKEK